MELSAQPPVIVIGMHRAGTSLLARILSELQVFMGLKLDVNHEATCFKDTNRDLLSSARAHWARPAPFVKALSSRSFMSSCQELVDRSLRDRLASYGGPTESPAWGWKDPRNTITLPVWLERFPGAKVINVVRDPVDVALSLHRRSIRQWLNISPEKRMLPPTIGACLRLWRQYVTVAQSHRSQSSPTEWFSLRYEDLLAEPERQIGQLGDFVGVGADSTEVSTIARSIISRPTRRSGLESLRLDVLSKTGLIDLDSYSVNEALPPHRSDVSAGSSSKKA